MNIVILRGIYAVLSFKYTQKKYPKLIPCLFRFLLRGQSIKNSLLINFLEIIHK